MKHPALHIALLIALLASAGCSSPPAKEPAKPAVPVARETPPREPADPYEAALARANSADQARRPELLMDAADVLLGRKDYAGAKTLLEDIRIGSSAGEQRARRAILLSEALCGTGNPSEGLAILATVGVGAESPLPRTLEAGLREARAKALLALDRPLESAMERAALQPWLTDDHARASNSLRTLDALGRVPLGELEQAAAQGGGDDWRGWIALSITARDMRRLPGAQQRALGEWEQRYAGIAAPGSGIMERVGKLASGISAPHRVALLLPLSGKAGASGQAVLQGYLAEHYRSLAAGEAVPALAIVDTGGTTEGFAAAYRKTTQDGAEVVIGPLLKEELLAFRSGLVASTPTLALNFLDAPAPIPGAWQFGIDLSDEVRELGLDAKRSGLSRAVVLADSSPRTQKLVEAFDAQWRAAGGELIDTLYLGDLNEYRSKLERTLHLDRSRQRSENLGALVGMELQTEPRRRMDIDLAVLLAEPSGARSIRALLPFLYSGDIPARATSMSYAAGSGQAGDLDLESLHLLDMPWFSGSEATLRAAASLRSGPGERLIALGIDAQRLQSRLALLDAASGWDLGGATGELRAAADGRIHRRTVWYVIDGGQARPVIPRNEIPTAASTEGAQAWTPSEGSTPQPSDTAPNPEP